MSTNKVILYIATSLDGFIARKNGKVDWLDKYNSQDFGYKGFLKSIDIIIMGNNTYKQILTFGEFPYKGKKCYVFTKNKTVDTDKNVTFVNSPVKKFMNSLNKKKIWLVGGAQIINEFLKYNLIDESIIFIMPELLGTGIPLFTQKNANFKLLNTKCYDSAVMIHYECK